MLESQTIFEVPNGGYGWVIVFGALLINMLNRALYSVFGLLFGSFFNSIGASPTEIALVMNLTSFFESIASILTGAVLKFFTIRQVSVTACILTSFGLTLSAFTVHIYQIILSFSLLVGIGFGLLNNITIVAVTSYFTTNKSRAISFSSAGTEIGQIILPQIIKLLSKHFDANVSIMIMGCLLLNGVIGALLFQAVEKHMKLECINENHALISKSNEIKTGENLKEASLWKKCKDILDLQLLQDTRFVILIIILACNYAASMDCLLIFPFLLIETAKLDQNQSATCLSVIATFDLISRFTFHFLIDWMNLSSRQILVVGIIVVGIIKTYLTFLTTYESILIACSIYGYVRAIVTVNKILAISEHCTKYYPSRFAGALGLKLVFFGIFVVIFGQLFGLFRDYVSDFSYSIYLENILSVSVLFIWFIEYLYHLRH
ncbi:monocarboxylate transporter 12-like [Chironomus tepperi]|uniref:monocarboxylate transporter 12-like n=1 Tax=Chironomus tepperi TaxID=113505 RepID=UPI00391F8A63